MLSPLAPLAALALLGACSSVTPATQGESVAQASALLASAPTKAVILIDSRLYAEIGSLVDQYRSLAETRRGFGIGLRVVSGLDDMTFRAVHDFLVAERSGNASLEGALFVGNVKLHSFYKTRDDILLDRLYPDYYQDLDAVFSKRYPDGAIDPVCDGTNDPFCVVSPRIDGAGPFTVPVHDLDQIAKGPNPDPELWASFMPVGVSGTQNTYADFAAQLRPYLQKVISFYQGALQTNGRYYFVSNDKGETFDLTWSAFGSGNIDFYGKPGPNGETGSACWSGQNDLCFTRWPTETYAEYASFAADYAAKPWVGEGWQDPGILTQQLNAALYDVAEWNEHSFDQGSIISSPQARALTMAGLIVALDGCGVAGFAQPGSPSVVDDPWTSVSDNISIALLYGSSQALAVLGDPHWRGHYAHFPTMYQSLKADKSYLGYAHLLRMKTLYAIAGSDAQALKEEAGEMLLGDPFMDLQPTSTGTGACTAPAWDRTQAYTAGAVVSFGGLQYTAAFWSEDSEPDLNAGGPGSGAPWHLPTICGGSCAGTTPWDPRTPWYDYATGDLRTGSDGHQYSCRNPAYCIDDPTGTAGRASGWTDLGPC